LGENFALLGKSTPKQKQNQTITAEDAEDAEKNQNKPKPQRRQRKFIAFPSVPDGSGKQLR
jgi:hypothetical protein